MGHLRKKSRPANAASCCALSNLSRYQQRYFVLRRMHLFWWKSKMNFLKGEECRGCLNLLVHHAGCKVDDGHASRFVLHPRNGIWNMPSSFNGGSDRDFILDCRGSEHSREKWLTALEAHLNHAEEVVKMLGQEWIENNAEVKKLSFESMHEAGMPEGRVLINKHMRYTDLRMCKLGAKVTKRLATRA